MTNRCECCNYEFPAARPTERLCPRCKVDILISESKVGAEAMETWEEGRRMARETKRTQAERN